MIEHLYFMVRTGCKPLYHYLNGKVFKGCYPDSMMKYTVKADTDLKDTYWAQELTEGRMHRYNEEEIRTLLGVEIES
jgi:hypothetical protein